MLRAEERLRVTFMTDRVSVHDAYDRVRWDKPEDTLEHVERHLWGAIVDQIDVRRFMSISAAEALDRQLSREKMPRLTAENVFAMAEGFRGRMTEMLQESIDDVFRRLTPQGHWRKFKSNNKFEVGRRVILTGMVEFSSWSGWGVRFGGAEAELRAIENVFTSLDGHGSITKAYYSAISTAIKAAPKAETCQGETPYFKFRGWRNGNLHLTIKRLDLLRRFNALAGGRRLKPEGTT